MQSKSISLVTEHIISTPAVLADLLNEFSSNISKLGDEVTNIRRNLKTTDEKVRVLDEEAPLNPAEADDISKAVKAKGCEVLGGKNSPAYKKIDLRKMVFQDIYSEIKRNFGLINPNTGAQLSYKKLRRKYFKGALNVIEKYEPGISLQNDIDTENDLGDID